jgi:hypothetical protein
MDALLLIAVYLGLTAILQALGYAFSQAVNYVDPAWGLLTFLLLFLGAFWLAWPIAVWVTDPKTSLLRRR